VDRSQNNPEYDEVFKSVCPKNRNSTVPFCGSCVNVNGSMMSETIGSSDSCVEGCKSLEDVELTWGVLGLCLAFIGVMKMLTSTHEGGGKVILIVMLKILLNYYQLVGLVVFSNVQTLIKPLSDLFSFNLIELNQSLPDF